MAQFVKFNWRHKDMEYYRKPVPQNNYLPIPWQYITRKKREVLGRATSFKINTMHERVTHDLPNYDSSDSNNFPAEWFLTQQTKMNSNSSPWADSRLCQLRGTSAGDQFGRNWRACFLWEAFWTKKQFSYKSIRLRELLATVCYWRKIYTWHAKYRGISP